ncbi:MAG: hypothetical protein R3E56_08435 [Burkholderiaceae bacterium]
MEERHLVLLEQVENAVVVLLTTVSLRATILLTSIFTAPVLIPCSAKW